MINKEYLEELQERILVAENERRAKEYSFADIVLGAVLEYENWRQNEGDNAFNVVLRNKNVNFPMDVLELLDRQRDEGPSEKLKDLLRQLKNQDPESEEYNSTDRRHAESVLYDELTQEEYTDDDLMEEAAKNRRQADRILEMIRSRNK